LIDWSSSYSLPAKNSAIYPRIFYNAIKCIKKFTLLYLFDALVKYGVPRSLADWIDHMLGNRLLETYKGDSKILGTITSGCPQGGVLSPLLWNLVVDELLTRITQMGCQVVGYADDIFIIARGPFLSPLVGVMQRALTLVDSWCNTTGLSINPSKIEVVVFTKNYKWDRNCSLKVAGQNLDYVDSAKYLGVILDSKLSWKKHLEYKCAKITAALWQTRRAVGTNWGLKPAVMLWIYEAILKPRLTYAALIWWNRSTRITAKLELEKLRGMILRGITGAMKSTPITALGALVGIEPFHLTLESEAIRAWVRVSQQSRERRTGARTRPLERAIEKMASAHCSDRMARRHLFDKKYRISLLSREDWSNNRIPAGDNWFTDGSVRAVGSGAGIYRKRPDVRISLPLGTSATVFQVELLAVIHCAHAAREEYNNNHVNIFCDSKSVLHALGNHSTRSKLVWDCYESLNTLAERTRVNLIWVPGHSDILGNTMADSLARRGAGEKFIGPEPAVGTCYTQFRNDMKLWIAEKHQKYWAHSAGCEQAKLFMGPHLPCRWRSAVTKSTRKAAKTFVSIITGHDDLRCHKHRQRLADDSLCRYCGEEDETAPHILCFCTALSPRRKHLTGEPLLEVQDIASLGFTEILSLWENLRGIP